MHCSEELTFYLFVKLVEDCNLRDIYINNQTPGVFKHKYIIRLLLMKHIPEIHYELEENAIILEDYAIDWIVSIFTMNIPEDNTKATAAFFTLFFKHDWELFYKLVLTIFQHIKE